jgi:RNA polymerase sigma factor (sigma-70 family)
MSAEPTPESPASQAPFADTPWSVVLRARHDSTEGRAALEKLCHLYWSPVYAFIRRRGFGREDAQDLTQGFFVSVLDGAPFAGADPARGRFRGFLAVALRWYLGDHRERLAAWKRGGRTGFISLDDLAAAEGELGSLLPAAGDDPARAFERNWARTVLRRALDQLAAEQTRAGKDRAFAVLGPFLEHPASRGDYAQAAATLGTTRTHIAVQVHRLHQRLGELLQREVGATVSQPGELRDELQHVLRSLGQ